MTNTLRFAAIILAAGEGRRMGGVAKALLVHEGRTLLDRAVTAAREAGATRVLVVTGAFREEVETAAKALGAETAHNADWASGMGSSIACGVRELGKVGAPLDALLVMASDLPRISAEGLVYLCGALEGLDGIAATEFEGGTRYGSPALFGAEHFEALARFNGNTSGRDYLKRHADCVCGVCIPDFEIDWDTPADAK